MRFPELYFDKCKRKRLIYGENCTGKYHRFIKSKCTFLEWKIKKIVRVCIVRQIDRQKNTSAFNGTSSFSTNFSFDYFVNIRPYASKINNDLHKQVRILIICNNIYKVI